MSKTVLMFLLLAAVVAGIAYSQQGFQQKRAARVLKLEELAYPDIQQLDREKTIFLLFFGIMEEHGPHLPIGTDWFDDIAYQDGLIAHLRKAHPDYDIILVAPMPLGVAGANDIAGQFEHPGSFTVRPSTLRAVAFDMGTTIARKGFKNIFLIAGHGMVVHNEPLNEAADFISERYHVRMVNLSSLVEGERDYYVENGQVKDRDENTKDFSRLAAIDYYSRKHYNLADLDYEYHAGVDETAQMLSCRPDLVKPIYKSLPAFQVKKMAEAQKRADWRGYWGAPSMASADFGKGLIDAEVQQYIKFAEMALRGENLSKLPRWPQPKELEEELVRREQELYAVQQKEFDGWLAAHHFNDE